MYLHIFKNALQFFMKLNRKDNEKRNQQEFFYKLFYRLFLVGIRCKVYLWRYNKLKRNKVPDQNLLKKWYLYAIRILPIKISFTQNLKSASLI